MPRDARGYALLPLVPHQPSAFLRRSSSPGAKFSVRLQETEAARRVIPPSSHAKLRLRIPGRGEGGQSATSGSKLGALVGAQGRYPSLNTSFPKPSWGGTCFSETGAPGLTGGRPRLQEATPLRTFYAGSSPGHLAQHNLPTAPVCGPASSWLLESPAGGAGLVRWLHWNANDRKAGTQGS